MTNNLGEKVFTVKEIKQMEQKGIIKPVIHKGFIIGYEYINKTI